MMISFENDSFTQNIVIKRKNDFVGAFEVKAIDKHNALKKGYSIILLLEQFIHALSNEKREMIRSTGMVRDLSKEDDCEFIRIKNPGSKAIFDDTLIQNEETINYVIVGYLRSNKNTRGLLSNAIKLHKDQKKYVEELRDKLSSVKEDLDKLQELKKKIGRRKE